MWILQIFINKASDQRIVTNFAQFIDFCSKSECRGKNKKYSDPKQHVWSSICYLLDNLQSTALHITHIISAVSHESPLRQVQRIQQFQKNKLLAPDHTSREKSVHNTILICLTHQRNSTGTKLISIYERSMFPKRSRITSFYHHSNSGITV